MACRQESEPLMVTSIQLAPKEDNVPDRRAIGLVKGIQFDFKKSLQDNLHHIFNHGGKALFAFPDSTYAQVRSYRCLLYGAFYGQKIIWKISFRSNFPSIKIRIFN